MCTISITALVILIVLTLDSVFGGESIKPSNLLAVKILLIVNSTFAGKIFSILLGTRN